MKPSNRDAAPLPRHQRAPDTVNEFLMRRARRKTAFGHGGNSDKGRLSARLDWRYARRTFAWDSSRSCKTKLVLDAICSSTRPIACARYSPRTMPKKKAPVTIRGLDSGSKNSEASPISILPLPGRSPS